jgi:hypothetical protein
MQDHGPNSKERGDQGPPVDSHMAVSTEGFIYRWNVGFLVEMYGGYVCVGPKVDRFPTLKGAHDTDMGGSSIEVYIINYIYIYSPPLERAFYPCDNGPTFSIPSASNIANRVQRSISIISRTLHLPHPTSPLFSPPRFSQSSH